MIRIGVGIYTFFTAKNTSLTDALTLITQGTFGTQVAFVAHSVTIVVHTITDFLCGVTLTE